MAEENTVEVKDDEVKDNEVKDNEVKGDEVKDNEVKDDEVKDDEVKDDEVKDDDQVLEDDQDFTSLATMLNADLAVADQHFYDEHNYEEALILYHKVAEEETDESLVTRALYWIGECLIKLGQADEAIEAFNVLSVRFAGHHLGESARRRVLSLQE